MPKSSRTKNSVLNLCTGFAGQFLVIILRFITRTVFIYTLGADYLGINGLFSDILNMLSLTELGLDTAMNYRLYEPLANHDDKQVRILLKFYKQAYRVIGIVIFCIGLLLIPALRFLIKDYDSLETLGINAVLIFILYLLQSVSSYLFFAYRSIVIKADQKTYITDLADMVVTVTTNIVQICILLFLHDFILYTATVILFNILRNMVNAIIAQRMYPDFFVKEKDSLSRSEIISMFKDCGAIFIFRVNGTVLKATDNIVLSSFIGLGIVGLYSNYLMFYTTIRSLLNKFYTACRASIGNLYVTSDYKQSYFFFEVMNFITAILFGTACVGVAVEADEVILNWIGSDYLIKQPFSILMGIEIMFVGLHLNLQEIRNVSGIFQKMWYRPLLGMIINLVLSIALVNVCGIYGVLIGTISSYLFTDFLIDPFVIHKYAFHNYKPVSNYYKKNLCYLMIIFIVGIADFWICNNILIGKGLLSMFFHIVICGVSVPLVLLVIYWRTDECRYLFNKVLSLLKGLRGHKN